MLTGNKLITPVSEGCLNGVMKAGLGIQKKWTIWRWLKKRSRPLIYKKADELFITNVIGNTAHNKIQEKKNLMLS
jgi:hypothetical protein